MNPNNVAASSILAAIWPQDDSVDAGNECFSHELLVILTSDTPAFGEARFIHEFLVFSSFNTLAFHHTLKAPLSCFALGPVAVRSWTCAAATRAKRPHQNEGVAAKEERAEHSLIHPQAVAPRKNFSALEGSPFMSALYLFPHNSHYLVPDLQNFSIFLDLPGRITWKPSWAECIDRLINLWTLPSSPLIPLWQVKEEKSLQSSSSLSSEIHKGWSRVGEARSELDLHIDSQVFQIQVNLSGNTTM